MENIIDDRPLAVRRKRRATSTLADLPTKEINRQQMDEEASTDDAPREPPKTPNRKKRTRFSDSVIEIGAGSMTDLTSAASSSTGLTPALNRTILIPIKSTDKVKKRLSLPTQLMTPAASRSSTSSPLSTGPIEFQFVPLSQKINDRTMRSLKRNHLSETTNEIHEENKRSHKALQQEIEELRNQLAVAKQPNNETDAVTNTTGATHEDTTRIEQLESEILGLKQEMREQSVAADDMIPENTINRSPSSPPLPIEVNDLDDFSAPADNVDLTSADSRSDRSDSSSVVTVAEASTQASLPSPAWLEAFRSARLEYEQLFPGETTAGLDVADAEPFIQTIISRIESLKKEHERLDQNISVSQTSRINMKNNFERVLHEIERHRNAIQANNALVKEEKTRANVAELEIATLEARVENKESKNNDLKKQRDDHQRSIGRLQDAIEHYRSEAEKLTQTVLQMEASHEAAIANLRLLHQATSAASLRARDVIHDDQASDLEAQIDAEKIGRLKAEESAVKRLERIRELENRQAELRDTVSQKQAIIRQLENQIEQKGSGHESEVGQLNVRIGELVSTLASINVELAKARDESTRLSKVVEEEKAAGLKAVESMQSEMKQCANKVDTLKDDHVEGTKKRGEQVAQSFGLMTPVVEGGRFRDAEADEKVEGHVELLRGKATKKRPDSGVGLWESTIEEEGGDGDVVMEDPEETPGVVTPKYRFGFLEQEM
ncbi:MAG: hypothetical protein Q9168_006952 [Polycauliona sp. 1 TL-2023]